jgi:hypothetical protein
MKFKITVEFEYEVNPEYYHSAGDPVPPADVMLDIDLDNFEDPYILCERLSMQTFTIKGEVVK